MTAHTVPLPSAPGMELVVLDVGDCQVCGNQERVVVSPVGAQLGTIVDCPGCTRRGARHLRALFGVTTEAGVA